MSQKTLFDPKSISAAPLYVVLDAAAAVAVETYFAARNRKRTHDRTSANLKKEQDTALAHVKAALDGERLGQLPDGRIIKLVTHDRHRRAQPASDFSYDELTLDLDPRLDP